MSGLSLKPVQQAVYNALTGDTTLMGLVSGVYDRVQQNTAYPYVTLGEAEQRVFDTATTQGSEIETTLHVWSREGGRKQALTILERLHTLLHNGSLTISGHALVTMRGQTAGVTLLDDGLTYHGRIGVRIVTQVTS